MITITGLCLQITFMFLKINIVLILLSSEMAEKAEYTFV